VAASCTASSNLVQNQGDRVSVHYGIIDLGPEGGARAGEVIATGTPEDVARVPASYTGTFLAELLPPRKSTKARKDAHAALRR